MPWLCAVLALLGCAGSSLLPETEPAGAPANPDLCVIDVVNGGERTLAVTVYARTAHSLGIIEPGRQARYSEECTRRTWSVTGVPRRSIGAEPERSAPISTKPASPVTRQVEVWPGHVARVVL